MLLLLKAKLLFSIIESLFFSCNLLLAKLSVFCLMTGSNRSDLDPILSFMRSKLLGKLNSASMCIGLLLVIFGSVLEFPACKKGAAFKKPRFSILASAAVSYTHLDVYKRQVSAKPSDGNEGEHIRFTIRGSGTEPKIKVYIEACADEEQRATFLAKLTWNVLKREWFRPEKMDIVTHF